MHNYYHVMHYLHVSLSPSKTITYNSKCMLLPTVYILALNLQKACYYMLLATAFFLYVSELKQKGISKICILALSIPMNIIKIWRYGLYLN